MKGKKTGGLALNSRGYAAPTVRLRNLWKRPTEEEAVEKALSEKPDPIVMDLGLPGISGIEAAKTLKENSSTAHIPIVAHSAWSVESWRERAQKAGMIKYLQKPVPIKVMKETIKKLFLGLPQYYSSV